MAALQLPDLLGERFCEPLARVVLDNPRRGGGALRIRERALHQPVKRCEKCYGVLRSGVRAEPAFVQQVGRVACLSTV